MNKKLIGLFMAFVMMISLATSLGSTTALAADGTDDGFVTSKTAELQDDGTYTITLEGYATGEEVRTVVTEHVATDVVLVLDVSGSMNDEIQFGTMTSLEVLDKEAPTGYYYFYMSYLGIQQKYKMRYYNGKWQYDPIVGSWTDIDGAFFESWIKSGNRPVYIRKIDATKLAVNRFIKEIHNDAVANNVQHNISIVKYAGDKYYNSNHLLEGNHMYESNSYNYTELVKNYVSAAPDANVTSLTTAVNALKEGGATSADYGMTIANDVMSQSTYKDNGNAKVVVMFTDGEPNHSNGFSTSVANSTIGKSKTLKTDLGASVYTVGLYNSPSTNMTNYMNYVSSNYPNASSMTSAGTKAASNFYLTASTAGGLDEIFKTIASEAITGGSVVTADSSTVVRDIITDDFIAPAASSVKAYTVDVDASASSSANAVRFKNQRTDAGLTAVVENNEVKVSGFDFAANWCGKDGYGTYRGKKLVIVISGVIPKESAFTGEAVNTNATGSGVYTADLSKQIAEFTKPETTLLNKAVVIDYAKTVELTGETLGLNSVSKFLNGTAVNDTIPTLKYGVLTKNGGSLFFTPNTTSWTGTDSVYAFGNDSDAQKAWSKASIMPASNVYYEDTFVGTASTLDANKSYASITYTGSWSKADEGKAEGSTTVDGVDGWSDALENAGGFTDGTAASTNVADADAYATIYFTGTGIDVYTKTDANSGMVIAKLTAADSDNTMKAKMLRVYNESKSGTYYSVPTLSFSDLEYGTYKLYLMVSADDATIENNQYEYCIDGIRIYNPGQTQVAHYMNLVDQIGETDKVFVDGDNTVTSVSSAKESGKNLGMGEIAQNEVLLKGAATVSFQVAGGEKYFIGMKSLTGDNVTAYLSKGKVNEKASVTLKHTADMYYQVTPDANGVISISNSGDGILALTKLQVVGGDASVATLSLIEGEEASVQAATFLSYATVDYSLEPVAEEEVVEPEEEVKEPEVEITEPEVVTPVKPAANQSIFKKIISIIFGFKKFFGK